MKKSEQDRYPTSSGYLTEKIRSKYIATAMEKKQLPENAHRMPQLISLNAPSDFSQPIQFWQLFSVLGPDRIVRIVQRFYQRVFADELWFSAVFSKLNSQQGHSNAQAAMWIDVMGGGKSYHGGEFRLRFHHSHNAVALMNERGAKRWLELMVATLDDPATDLGEDPRVRSSLNSFLSYFMGKYADEFDFSCDASFGETNAAVKRRINLMNLSDDAIEGLSDVELREALAARGLDLMCYPDRQSMIRKAQSL